MSSSLKSYFKKNYPLWLSFFLPIIIMGGYFAYRHMYPFGSSSLLTVDLGQQYVDFFAFFRRTLLHSPSSFFYSFSKAIGGEMLGEWAYYLLSPFNLLFLFFSGKSILTGVMVVTLLKYGCAGLTFGYLLYKQNIQRGLMIPAFATSYALMGWAIANQLNLLWIDALVFLPLIVLYLMRLLTGKSRIAYILWLALMLIVNYYMAYMICIFLALFFIWYEVANWQESSQFFRDLWKFISRSVLAAGLAAVVLLPTFASLTTSKGQYTENSVHFKFEYAPLKMLSKFIIGAFNFDQMPKGYPNLFVGSLVLVGFILFFCLKKISLKTRVATLIITLFLFLSLCFEPLDLFWHGMQFPVWYPYRFSYLVSFWLIFMAAMAFRYSNFDLDKRALLSAIIVYAIIIAYSWINKAKFSYLTTKSLVLTTLFAIAILLVLSLKVGNSKTRHLKFGLLFFLAVIEMGFNATASLKNISYLTAKDYTYPETALAAASDLLSQKDHGLYRTGQTFSRTKNDGLALGLNAGSYFSSALEKSIPDFYGQMGEPDGDNYVTYSGGTLITDSLLGMKYYIQQNAAAEKNQSELNIISEKKDLKKYKEIASTKLTNIYRNPLASSIAYLSSPLLKKTKILYNDPITYQTNWLNAATATMPTTRYFTPANFDFVSFQNVGKQTNLTGATLKKRNSGKTGQVVFKFVPTTNNPYYITLGSDLDSDYADLYLGNRPLHYYSTFRHTTVINVANHDKGKTITLTARLKKNTLWLNNFVLYQMNAKLVKQKLKQIRQGRLKVTSFNQRSITGTVTAKSGQIMATTIPYSKGWTVKVDGKKVSPYKVQNTFLAFNIPAGKHTVKMTFWPPMFKAGMVISLVTIIILLGMSGIGYRRKKEH